MTIDFFGLDQQIENPVIEVGRGAVENLLVAEDDKRSRIVVNLIAPASFETIYRSNGMTLIVNPVELTSNVVGSPKVDSASDRSRVSLLVRNTNGLERARMVPSSGIDT